MSTDSLRNPRRIALRFDDGGAGTLVGVKTEGRCVVFSREDWDTIIEMDRLLRLSGAPRTQNFSDLPTRTPIHANTPLQRKATLDDLI